MKQKTIAAEIKISGVGLHTGAKVNMTFKPAPVNHGIKFKRVDLPDQPIIVAEVSRVLSTNRGTTLQEGVAQVWTVEHSLSALSGMEIDNVLIELDGPEIPILDGSAYPFIKALEAVGVVLLDAQKEYFEIEEPIEFTDEETGAEYLAVPGDKFELTTMIDFNSKILGQQFASLDDIKKYGVEIAPCRTFVFIHELEKLMQQNLIKGGDLENAIVIVDRMLSQEELDDLARKLNKPSVKVEHEGVLNTTKLHFINEPARHKLLDVLGDLTLLGKPILGKIVSKKPGHKSNVEFARLLKKKMSDSKKMKGIPEYNPDNQAVFTTEQIKGMLPHRYPFLMVDKIMELTDKLVIGIKNITYNEGLFQGHFPGNPIFPGVLQIEAMAQTGGILVLSTKEDPDKWDTYFLKIENARFKSKVVPGDTLIIKMELAEPVRRGIVHMLGSAYVGSRLVSEADLTAQIVKRDS